MTYDNQKAIRRALRISRSGYFGGGVANASAQGSPDGAGAPPKGFSPNGGEGAPPQAMGSSDAAGAPAKGFTPGVGGEGGNPQNPQVMGYSDAAGAPAKGFTPREAGPPPVALPTGPSTDFYQNLMSGMQSAQPSYRAFQPTDFGPGRLRQTYTFDPATDPSRRVNAELARLAAERASQANQEPESTPPYDPYFLGGGYDSP